MDIAVRPDVCNDLGMTKLPFAVAIALLASCGNEAKWERARAEYCQELELLSNRVKSDLDNLADALRRQAGEPQPDGRQCGFIHRDLLVVGARLDGFRTAQKVLAVARPEKQTLEQAGFGARLDLTPLQSYDAEACLSGRANDAATKVAEVRQAMDADFQAGLTACRAVGWRTGLAK